MEVLRLFLVSFVILLVGFLVYPIAMGMVSPSIDSLLNSNISIFERIVYTGLPVILAIGIILYAISGGLRNGV